MTCLWCVCVKHAAAARRSKGRRVAQRRGSAAVRSAKRALVGHLSDLLSPSSRHVAHGCFVCARTCPWQGPRDQPRSRWRGAWPSRTNCWARASIGILRTILRAQWPLLVLAFPSVLLPKNMVTSQSPRWRGMSRPPPAVSHGRPVNIITSDCCPMSKSSISSLFCMLRDFAWCAAPLSVPGGSSRALAICVLYSR